MNQNLDESLRRNVELLAETTPEEENISSSGCAFPSIKALKDAVDLVKSIVFPDYFGRARRSGMLRTHYIGANVEKLFSILLEEIGKGFHFCNDRNWKCIPQKIAADFIGCLPEIKRLLLTDVEAMFNNDPAVENKGEVILCYPVVHAMIHYRIAHALLELGVPVIPRILTELAHSATGIDIHPGARIGEYFAIDHGTGVVIGETAIIGNHVTLYQGVTLGAKNFSLDSQGHPVNIPRHPIIEDNVTIYSNATVLGRITVGKNSIIGGNIWLTYSVPPGSKILQRRAVSTSFTDGLGI